MHSVGLIENEMMVGERCKNFSIWIQGWSVNASANYIFSKQCFQNFYEFLKTLKFFSHLRRFRFFKYLIRPIASFTSDEKWSVSSRSDSASTFSLSIRFSIFEDSKTRVDWLMGLSRDNALAMSRGFESSIWTGRLGVRDGTLDLVEIVFGGKSGFQLFDSFSVTIWSWILIHKNFSQSETSIIYL